MTEFIGHELDFAYLQRAADAIASIYQEAGWIVRVSLPEQNVGKALNQQKNVFKHFTRAPDHEC